MITATMTTDEFLAYRKAFTADLRAGIIPVVICEDYTMPVESREALAKQGPLAVRAIYCETVPMRTGGNRCDYLKVSAATRDGAKRILEVLYGSKLNYICVELTK